MSRHDLEWGGRTGGRLSATEEAVLVLAAAGALVRERLPRSRSAVDLVVAEQPPDSLFARRCLATAQERTGRVLLQHCLRTWLWADLVAQLDDVQADPELLYAACLLHDLGLVPTGPSPLPPDATDPACFAVEGAVEAHAIAVGSGYPRATELADAVALHLDVSVPMDLGAEAHLLHAGASMDSLAIGLARIPSGTRATVLARHPRDGLLTTLIPLLGEEAVRRPRSRVGVMQRRLGFTDRLRHADARFCS